MTEEIANIRKLPPHQSIDSPNRFEMFHSIPDMFDFIEQLRSIGGKPVGIKLVVGHKENIEELASYMKKAENTLISLQWMAEKAVQGRPFMNWRILPGFPFSRHSPWFIKY